MSCCRFFDAFDNDRPSLLAAYAPICTFSFHADTAHPARARAKKVGSHGDKRFPHQHKLDWKPYLTAEGSRNLMRVKNPGTSHVRRQCWFGRRTLLTIAVSPVQRSASRPCKSHLQQ